jgi:hypothetical protein
MESVDAKIARARVHLSTFETDVGKFIEQARPRFIRKVDHESTKHWLVFFVEDPYPPIELSVVIGDFLHNLRSALDNLICGLVRKGNPTSTCSGRQFPIFIDRDKYLAKRSRMLKGVPKEACTLIDGLQPQCRPETTRELDPLWILNTLCNRDKHRAANLTFCVNKNVELLVPLRNGSALHIKLPQILYADQVTPVMLPGDPSLIEDNVQVQIRGRSSVNFRSTDQWAERSVDELLVTCLQYVEDRIIPSFKPYFR